MKAKTKRLSPLAATVKRFGRAAEATINKITKAEKGIAANRGKVDRYFFESLY